jgi:phage tail-like protein
LRVKTVSNPDTWLDYLPAIYLRDKRSRDFLERLLRLYQSALEEVEANIDGLPRLFDPFAVSDSPQGESWLDWLAGWLGFELDERWNPDERRRLVAEAFELWARRGTAEGLRRLLKYYTESPVLIDEPAQHASLWTLGDDNLSALGFTTMLAPAQIQGAVVGTTAVLRGSHLIPDSDFGASAFDDLAHRFCVRIYASAVKSRADLQQIHALLEREKPAHTHFSLCLIEARMRVGFQAYIGVDTIIGRFGKPLVMGETHRAGIDTVLEDPALTKAESRISESAHLGRTTILK